MILRQVFCNWHFSFLFYIYLIYQASANEMEFVSVEGEMVALPCNNSTFSPDRSLTLIRWFRQERSNPIYTLDSRKTTVDTARHFPAPEMEGRAYFDTTVHPPQLRIDPVYASDRGEYRCRVDFLRARSVIYSVRLDVIVPPEEVMIFDNYGRKLRGVIGPYNEGDRLELTCESKGGEPPPKVIWSKGSKEMTVPLIISRPEILKSVLVLSELKRTDLMDVYTCKAYNSNMTKPHVISVKIDINLRPLKVKILGKTRSLLAGQKIEVICECIGSRPRPHLRWMKSGVTQRSRELVAEGGNVTKSILSWNITAEDDEKVLLCIAENPSIPKIVTEDTRILSVHYKPQVNLVLKEERGGSSVYEKSDVILVCNIQSNPEVSIVEWLYEEKSLPNDSLMELMSKNTTLYIRDVQRHHSGKYRCLASNAVGQGVSDTLRLTVKFSPACSQSANGATQKIGRNEMVNVTCNVEANPEDVTFHWSLRNPAETAPLRTWLSNRSFTSFSSGALNFSNEAILMCWGANEVGIQELPCTFRITVVGPPERLRNCLVINQTAQTAAIMCEPSDDGGLPQVFHVEVYSVEEMKLVLNMTAKERPFFLVKELRGDVTYLVLLYASNSKGKSEWKSLTLGATSLQEKMKTVKDDNFVLDPLMSGLIGAMVGIPLFIAFIIVAFRRRKLKSVQNLRISDRLNERKSKHIESRTSFTHFISPPGNDITKSNDHNACEKCFQIMNCSCKRKVTRDGSSSPCIMKNGTKNHCSKQTRGDFSNEESTGINQRELAVKRATGRTEQEMTTAETPLMTA